MNSKVVPVINIANLHTSETLRALDCACRNWGVFQIVGHGVEDHVIGDLHQAMHEFFYQPSERKQAISRSKENPWGFFDKELTKNTLDWKEVFDYGPSDDTALVPQWPESLPVFEQSVMNYYSACQKLGFRLLGAIATNLGVAPELLEKNFRSAHSSFVRLNYYPVCPEPSRPEKDTTPDTGYLGVNHHTDAGALTILLQDQQPGLEAYREGEWHLVETRKDALVINLGDIVQVWSNDRYQAPLHRVVTNPNAERFSAPFFFNPSYSTEYLPLPTTIDVNHPAHYRSINWGEFREQRMVGDYADYGEEIQISHFRT